MKPVVLAAGGGTRLRPLTEDTPTVLVEVDGTPLLEDVFDNLMIGVGEFVVVGYLKEKSIGRTIEAVEMEGWRVEVGYPEDREQAEERFGVGQGNSMGS